MSLQELVSESTTEVPATRNKLAPAIDLAKSMQKVLTGDMAKKIARTTWIAHSIPCTALKIVGLTAGAGVLDNSLEHTYIGQKWNQYHHYIVDNVVAEVVGPLMGEVKRHRFSPIATYSQDVHDVSHVLFDGLAITTVALGVAWAGYKIYKNRIANR